MKPLLLAVVSALCALGCLTSAAAALLCLCFLSGPWLALLVGSVLLGALAKALDRQKMRSIYGRDLGDAMHESDLESSGCIELARNDVVALLTQRSRSTN